MRVLILVMSFLFFLHPVSSQQLQKAELLSETLKRSMQAEQAAAIAIAREQGFPVRVVTRDGVIAELQAMEHGRPLYYATHNAKAAKTISTDKVWTLGILGYSLSGDAMTLGMWEGGAVYPDHNEFAGRITHGDGGSNITDHATHTAGTLIAGGIRDKARGMAFKATLRSFDWNSDLAEMASQAGEGLTLSNHSYGPQAGWFYDLFDDGRYVWYGDPAISETEDYQFGYYHDRARQWDDFIYQMPQYLAVVSAGNDRSELGPYGAEEHWVYNGSSWELVTTERERDGGSDDYDSISGFAVAKNVLTVGAIKPFQNGYSRPDDVLMTAFSCWGPTDDGRIKPDIVADGLGVYSTSKYEPDSYFSRNGTSSAAPSVTGSIVLLKEHFDDLYNPVELPSFLIKALVIHTADEAGTAPGPDYRFGWGVMNSARAIDLISMDHAAGGGVYIREFTIQSGQPVEFQIQASGDEPLRATLCWSDPAGPKMEPALNPRDIVLVNDLDLRISGPAEDGQATEYKPWTLDVEHPSRPATPGDNIRDNVEQILIANPKAGIYTVQISAKGSIQNDKQAAGLILSGNVVSKMQKPAAPVPTSPANNAELEASETKLEWQDVEGAVSYTLQIYRDVNLTDLFLQEDGIRANVYPLEGLLQNKDFYWRLFAVNPAGKSEASAVSHFTTNENAVPLVWEKISPPELDFFVRDIIVNQKGHIFVSLIPPSNLSSGDYTAKKGTYRSVDEGQTWEKIGIEYSKYARDSNGILYGIGGGKLDRLGRNGEDKEQLYRNRNAQCSDIYLDKDDGIWLAYNNGLIMYSRDMGTEWQQFSTLSMQPAPEVKSMAWIGEELYLTTWGDGILCSSDSGDTWKRITPNTSLVHVYTIKGGNDGKLWAGTVGGLYYANKNDLNWQSVDDETLKSAKVTSIVINECGVIYAGNYGCDQLGIGVFVSVDHGAGWMSVSEGLNHMSAHIVYESPQGYLYTGIGSGNTNEGGAVYRGSHDKVLETLRRESGLSEPLAVTLISPDEASLQNGENLLLQWQALSDVCSYQVQVSPNSGFVNIVVDRETAETITTMSGLSDYTQYYWRVRAINAFGAGPWSDIRSFSTDPSVLVSKSDREIPESFALYATYPNPFNPVTTVAFDIAEPSFARVNVYNLNGRMVATLFSRSVTPGSYEATWDAREFSSGMYIIALKAGAFKAVRKCLLLK